MYKKGIILVAMISGVIASENPFEVENALEKIEQDEGNLLNALSKEQVDVDQTDSRSASKNPEQKLPQEVKNIESNIKKPKVEKKNPIEKKSNINKPENNKPKLLETKEAKDIKESPDSPKVEEKPKIETKSKTEEKPKIEIKPKIEEKPKLEIKPKPKKKKEPKLSREEMIKKQIEKVDAKIRDLEAKLNIAKGKVAKMPKPKLTPKQERAKAEEEAARLKRKKELEEKERERQIELEKIRKFEKDLQEAIFSVDG